MNTDIRRAQRLTLGNKPLLAASSAETREAPKAPLLRSGQGVAAAQSLVERTAGNGVRAVTSLRPADANPDADTMRHIEFLSSPELRGRGSPSPGFDAASKYVADLMKKYGCEGVNTGDPSGNPYFQTFGLFTLGDHASHVTAPRQFGRELFQKGFYLDATTSKEEHDIIRGRFGHLLPKPPGFSGNFSVDFLERAGVTASNVQNVVGVIRGTGPQADEYIVLMAHLDHVGAQGSRIFPGADDNASGSASLISALPQLQELQKAGKLNRSIIVLLTAAEEKGLVGSRYFVKHPLPGIPLTAIKGCYNTDMVGRMELNRMSLGVGGRKPNFMADVVLKANEALGDRKFTVVNRDVDGFESRQDGASFTAVGIPSVFGFEGLTNPKGGGDLHEDYHQPTDTADKIIRDNGGEKPRRFRDLAVEIARIASNTTITG